MSYVPRKPKTTVFTMFLVSDSKNHGIYSVFWLVPSKNMGIYAVFSMLKEVFLPCQKHKQHCKLQCFGSCLGTRTRKTANIGQKMPKMTSKKASCNFIVVFPTPDPTCFGVLSVRGRP